MACNDRDALICDLAETYHIYDMRQFPLSYIATLATRLPMNSRSVQAVNKLPVPFETFLLAQLVDEVRFFRYSFSNDAKHKRNRPKSIVQSLLDMNKPKENYEVFDNPEDFWALRNSIVKGGE